MSARSIYSRLSAKSQTIIPREIRDKLDLKPGDTLRYRETDVGVVIDKARTEDDPFDCFDEWSSEADEKAYADL